MVETLLYYDGDKLQVDEEENIIYAWYDYFDDYEEWFKVDIDSKRITAYLDGKISLYEILITGKTSLFKRRYSDLKDYDFEEITNFDNFEMPTKDSYLK